MEPGAEGILTHLRRGALEYCVLALLRRGPHYGLDIARRLGAGALLMNGEGTLYPLLARLRRAGLVETTWQESRSGPPRRYYALTGEGEAALARFAATWGPFRDAVDAALTGTSTSEGASS
ncbi:PadR family transcriptional regulator [Georgenia faecalis]|uniref:PadR family transcriptional regulator n=1 Tax=Georgenia faecalis TaxID=2483799 RepID=UPI000FDC62AB|nr:PadR family transcriptional regulator [Georgenia faecalis]